MKYTEEFFITLKKNTNNFLHFLQECKYSNSWDTKVDLNQVIKLIANYDYVLTESRKEIYELNNKVKVLEEEKLKLQEEKCKCRVQVQ